MHPYDNAQVNDKSRILRKPDSMVVDNNFLSLVGQLDYCIAHQNKESVAG